MLFNEEPDLSVEREIHDDQPATWKVVVSSERTWEEATIDTDNYAAMKVAILIRQTVLKRRVSPEAWRTFLKLEEAETGRLSHALDTVASWAFVEGVEAAKARGSW